ncbi:uncharacterized protein TNIN_13701 [Trichonephila inaurata madagascariensis]|uniref:Uncharacterized protein n=1 Tax=Trichonephila inaurata madagascariensis TaxID=2747483 RepID=A0A8X7BS75_9ARAC|nr:uncharacterized protein TNIN_13701 [Trichonephila inaurata madagascariensis]
MKKTIMRSNIVPCSESTSAEESEQCVGRSGDQERCDNFLACTKKFPKRLDDEFHTCIKNNYPGGTLNKCTENQNLFGSEDVFNKYLLCFLDKLPEKSSLSSEETKQFNEYKKCIQKEGGKCFKDRGVPS